MTSSIKPAMTLKTEFHSLGRRKEF